MISAASFGETVYLEFSGSANQPLTVTILAPVTLTITESSDEIFITFVDVGNGNVFASEGFGSGSTGYSINNGPRATFQAYDSGLDQGDTHPTDEFFYTSLETVHVNPGDKVTLLAGSFTTNGPIVRDAPEDGEYTIFVANLFGTDITAVPEPSTCLLLGLGVSSILLSPPSRPALRRPVPAAVTNANSFRTSLDPDGGKMTRDVEACDDRFAI